MSASYYTVLSEADSTQDPIDLEEHVLPIPPQNDNAYPYHWQKKSYRKKHRKETLHPTSPDTSLQNRIGTGYSTGLSSETYSGTIWKGPCDRSVCVKARP